jgi:hypothetical protein
MSCSAHLATGSPLSLHVQQIHLPGLSLRVPKTNISEESYQAVVAGNKAYAQRNIRPNCLFCTFDKNLQHYYPTFHGANLDDFSAFFFKTKAD